VILKDEIVSLPPVFARLALSAVKVHEEPV
jgi:hypothetical protein